MNKNNNIIDFSPESAPLRRTVLLIYAAATAILLLLLGRNALSNSEAQLAQCVREFTLGIDLFNGQNVAPLPETSTLFTGRIYAYLTHFPGISEWFLRLVSAFSALMLFAGTMSAAEKIFDRKSAFTAGWLLLGTYGFLYWGRHISWHMM